MAYPTTILANSDPVGTSNLSSPDHAAQHTTVNDDLTQVENKLGLGSGSASVNALLIGSGAGTSAWGTTWNNANLGTPNITGGTSTTQIINNPTIGTPNITGGTTTGVTSNSPTIGTPTVTGGTYNNGVFGSPSITGGTAIGYQSTYHTFGSAALSPGTSTTGTLNLGTATRFLINMPASAGSVTLVVSNVSSNQPFIVEILQGAAGAGTINWFSTVSWLNNGTTAPSQGTTAGRKNTYGFIATGAAAFDGYVVGKGE